MTSRLAVDEPDLDDLVASNGGAFVALAARFDCDPVLEQIALPAARQLQVGRLEVPLVDRERVLASITQSQVDPHGRRG
jgi:hypothetical protein